MGNVSLSEVGVMSPLGPKINSSFFFMTVIVLLIRSFRNRDRQNKMATLSDDNDRWEKRRERNSHRKRLGSFKASILLMCFSK